MKWCDEHQTRLSTRRGIDEYHRSSWPRRTKCKEGNLAYFYDHWGYDEYDVVAQLDADHVPEPGYLESMVRPFQFERVGYVAAPSICDSNAADSWAARGRLYKEAPLHGPLQAGCNQGFAPVCIGSHYAVRASALREIGGIGPELAEDFTTSFLMNSAGWEGAFALDAEAHGEGPSTFSAFLVQEFQWSQSLTVVGLRMYFEHFKHLTWRLRLRFGMALLYYPMLAITTVAALLLAPIAVVTGVPWMNVNYFGFLGRWLLIALPLVLAMLLLRRRGVLRPTTAKIFSWEAWLFAFARWPYVAWGVCSGVMERIKSSPRTIKVTPKGERALEVLPVRLILPYLAVCTVALGAVWGRSARPAIHFYVVLCLLTAGSYLLVAGAVTMLHAVEAQRTAKVGWTEVVPAVRICSLAVIAVFAFWAITVGVVVPRLF
jgi:cellulose synthase/poly-beta-1,6-N-acetylglucosamine synthase-like glycosyltransferase